MLSRSGLFAKCQSYCGYLNVLKATCSSKPIDDVPVFRSKYSLDKVYPESKLDVLAPQTIPDNSQRFSGYIPMNKLTKSFARSGGPGGQHVNKRNTKVTVSFHLSSADWIPEKTREKLAEIHKNSISKDGWWSVRSEKTREQHLNLADCVDKLRCYITEADVPIVEPSVEILEEKRVKAEKAAERRLQEKRHYSHFKAATSAFI